MPGRFRAPAAEKLVCLTWGCALLGIDQTRGEKCHCVPPLGTRVLHGDCWQDFRFLCGDVGTVAPGRTRLVVSGLNKLMSSSEGRLCIVPML